MRRREFIGLIGTIGAVWPRNLVAQPADQLRRADEVIEYRCRLLRCMSLHYDP